MTPKRDPSSYRKEENSNVVRQVHDERSAQGQLFSSGKTAVRIYVDQLNNIRLVCDGLLLQVNKDTAGSGRKTALFLMDKKPVGKKVKLMRLTKPKAIDSVGTREESLGIIQETHDLGFKVRRK